MTLSLSPPADEVAAEAPGRFGNATEIHVAMPPLLELTDTRPDQLARPMRNASEHPGGLASGRRDAIRALPGTDLIDDPRHQYGVAAALEHVRAALG